MHQVRIMSILFTVVKIVAALSILPFFPVVFLLAAMAGGGPNVFAPFAAIIGVGILVLMGIVLAACFGSGRPKWYVFAATAVFPTLLLSGYRPWFLH